MVTLAEGLRLAGAFAGAVGGALLALEFFQVPSYVNYEPELDSWNVEVRPTEVTEHTFLGQAGGLLVALGFSLLFLGEFL